MSPHDIRFKFDQSPADPRSHPEIKLWASVLARAFHEAKRLDQYEQVYWWVREKEFTNEPGGFEFVCAVVGKEVELTRKRIIERIASISPVIRRRVGLGRMTLDVPEESDEPPLCASETPQHQFQADEPPDPD